MSAFPKTSVTLIAKIKELSPGADSAAWVRFWDTYQGPVRALAARLGGESNADDILMQVFAKLVDVLREGQYQPAKGRFHSYLATMIANEVHMARRRDVARGIDQQIPLDAPVGGMSDESAMTMKDTLVAAPTEIVSDADWEAAIIKHVTEFVLTKTALSERDRAIYRAFALEERDIAVVAREHGVSRNMVSQIKTRINKRIAALAQDLLRRLKEL